MEIIFDLFVVKPVTEIFLGQHLKPKLILAESASTLTATVSLCSRERLAAREAQLLSPSPCSVSPGREHRDCFSLPFRGNRASLQTSVVLLGALKPVQPPGNCARWTRSQQPDSTARRPCPAGAGPRGCAAPPRRRPRSRPRSPPRTPPAGEGALTRKRSPRLPGASASGWQALPCSAPPPRQRRRLPPGRRRRLLPRFFPLSSASLLASPRAGRCRRGVPGPWGPAGGSRRCSSWRLRPAPRGPPRSPSSCRTTPSSASTRRSPRAPSAPSSSR